MAACPSGAEPTPEFQNAAVYIQATAIGATALEFISGFWPLAVPTSVLAVMPVTQLCNTNPDDPGNLTLDKLSAFGQSFLFGGPIEGTGSLAQYILDKATYNTFTTYCKCRSATETPPPPIIVTPPTGITPYPPGDGAQDPYRRLLASGGDTMDGLRQLYNGLQDVKNRTYDSIARHDRQFYNRPVTHFQMQGEGQFDLPYFPYDPTNTKETNDWYGLQVTLTQIPPSVRRQGTALPRLYGVGSVYFESEGNTGSRPLIHKRHSLHFENEAIPFGRVLSTSTVHYRLMPGVVADAGLLEWAPADQRLYPGAFVVEPRFDFWEGDQAPPGWVDKPIYPVSPPPQASGGGLPP